MNLETKDDLLFIGTRFFLPGMALIVMHFLNVRFFLYFYSFLVLVMGAFYLSLIIIQDLSDFPEIRKLVGEQRDDNNHMSWTRAFVIIFEIYVAVQSAIFGVYLVPASLILTACVRQAVVGTSFVE